jgi:hypothetical protein
LAWRKGSFILNLPLTSFDHLVGAGQQSLEGWRGRALPSP